MMVLDTTAMKQTEIPEAFFSPRKVNISKLVELMGSYLLMLAAWEQRSSTDHQTDCLNVKVISAETLIMHQCLNFLIRQPY